MKYLVGCLALLLASTTLAAGLDQPIVGEDVIFEEVDGIVAVEAEFFNKQSQSDIRRWYRTSAKETPNIKPDGDPKHVANASNNAYIEILPDTRRTHGDKLISGQNFSNNPTPPMAVIHYMVYFNTPGRYYVWCRAHSTGSEDNGLHVGIDGTWPETGHRLQWCEGKKTWRWESKQRTEKVHCGEPHKIYLDVEAGLHEITFAMREDGFEFDKFIMTKNKDFARPADTGPAVRIKQGTAPPPYPVVKADPKPASAPAAAAAHATPQAATNTDPMKGVHLMKAVDFPVEGNFYKDQDKWFAINPNNHKEAKTTKSFTGETGMYDLVLFAVGENDGKSEFTIKINDKIVGEFVSPLSTAMYAEGKAHNELWENVSIKKGDKVTVISKVGSKDGQEYSRGRWAGVAFADIGKGKTLLAKSLSQSTIATAAPTKKQGPVEPKLPFSNPKVRLPDGKGAVKVGGDLRQWHKVTLTLDGPFAHELDNKPNPFTDYCMTVVFKHSSGEPSYEVPGYFAADGAAGETSADAGTQWRAHLCPDKTGKWDYEVKFVKGNKVAVDENAAATPVAPYDGKSGSFSIRRTNKRGIDFRGQGRLQYVGKHHLQFAKSGKFFLKAGPDAPETFLAYEDFDATYTVKNPLKSWEPHLKDYKKGDPTWQDGKGKSMIGALNYLANKGVNAVSFLTYNAGGDGDNIWPFIKRDAKFHYDCSKLDQWQVVFDHAQKKGLYLHFKTQETENDDNFRKKQQIIPASLDGGDLGPERKLYYRELIARFGYQLALNWNLGEENTQTPEQQKAMAQYFHDNDPYNHLVVIHTYPNWQERVYVPLLGEKSKITGASLQNGWNQTHKWTLRWVTDSAAAGKPWVVANDEQGSASQGAVPDTGYQGFDPNTTGYDLHDVRKQTLWGNIMAGGAGVEYYFGYKLPENDLLCEDYRSRDQSWDYCRIAIEFFDKYKIPFQDMVNRNGLIGNPENKKEKYCLAKDGEIYLVYLGYAATSDIDLTNIEGTFDVQWFNPRKGGKLQSGSIKKVSCGGKVALGDAPSDPDQDWVVILRK